MHFLSIRIRHRDTSRLMSRRRLLASAVFFTQSWNIYNLLKLSSQPTFIRTDSSRPLYPSLKILQLFATNQVSMLVVSTTRFSITSASMCFSFFSSMDEMKRLSRRFNVNSEVPLSANATQLRNVRACICVRHAEAKTSSSADNKRAKLILCFTLQRN